MMVENELLLVALTYYLNGQQLKCTLKCTIIFIFDSQNFTSKKKQIKQYYYHLWLRASGKGMKRVLLLVRIMIASVASLALRGSDDTSSLHAAAMVMGKKIGVQESLIFTYIIDNAVDLISASVQQVLI